MVTPAENCLLLCAQRVELVLLTEIHEVCHHDSIAETFGDLIEGADFVKVTVVCQLPLLVITGALKLFLGLEKASEQG